MIRITTSRQPLEKHNVKCFGMCVFQDASIQDMVAQVGVLVPSLPQMIADADFSASAGRASAEVLTFYPPGIPVLCPGEIITREIIEYTQRCQRTGLKVVGPDDASLRTIKVVKQ